MMAERFISLNNKNIFVKQINCDKFVLVTNSKTATFGEECFGGGNLVLKRK